MLGLAVLAGAGVALLLGALALRASGIYFLMLTLALGQMAWALVSNNDLRDVLGGDIGLIGVGRPELLAGVRLAEPSSFYYLVLALATLSFAFLTVVVSSPFGRTLEGIRENEHRMRALGYPVFRYRLAAFVIAGGVAGLAGMLAATFSNAANPALAYWTTSGLALIAAIIGGVRSLLGPAIGAAIVVIMQVSVAVQVGAVSATLLPIGLVFVAFVLFAPGGLVRLARFRG
jgi:branched-chain amino acid transport system permease protein